MASKAETFRTKKSANGFILGDHEHENSELINMTKNCEKSQLERKIVRLAIVPNTWKIAIFAAACKPGHKWQTMQKTYDALLSSDGSNKVPVPKKLFSSNAMTIVWFYRIKVELFKIITLNNNTILHLHSHSKRSSRWARTQQKRNRETAWGKNFLRNSWTYSFQWYIVAFIATIYGGNESYAHALSHRRSC